MRIAFVASELAPHAHVGGLGDVARWLPRALSAGGDEVRVFLPAYDDLDPAGLEISPEPGIGPLDLGPLGAARLLRLGGPGPGPMLHLVETARWRGPIYAGGDDEHQRYAALCAAVPAACAALGWGPDVVHANDWHAGLMALHLEAAGILCPMVFTIHNLAYQGRFPAADLDRMGLGGREGMLAPADVAAGEVNSLRTGIITADVVTTVSPGFAREIVEPERGMGLDSDLRSKGDRLIGILNGIGEDWDPRTDSHLPRNYGPGDLEGKAVNTTALRAEFGLADRPGAPVLGIVSRMDRQKGFVLVHEALPSLLAAGRVQLAVIGTGDPEIEAGFAALADRFPGDAGYRKAFDLGVAHLIEAGAHMFLMPSVFEPSGLNQMYSLRYGTVPVVHRTGGLADSVEEWDGGAGTGFLFAPHTPEAFAEALGRALDVFADPGSWQRLVANGMSRDFSWEARADEYRRAYRMAGDPAVS
jgi:starch synthase